MTSQEEEAELPESAHQPKHRNFFPFALIFENVFFAGVNLLILTTSLEEPIVERPWLLSVVSVGLFGPYSFYLIAHLLHVRHVMEPVRLGDFSRGRIFLITFLLANMTITIVLLLTAAR